MKQVCVLGNGQLGRMLRGPVSRWALRSGPSGWMPNQQRSLFSKA